MRGNCRSGFVIYVHVLCLQGVGRGAAAEVTYIPAYKATSGTNIGVMNVANRVKGLQQQFKVLDYDMPAVHISCSGRGGLGNVL